MELLKVNKSKRLIKPQPAKQLFLTGFLSLSFEEILVNYLWLLLEKKLASFLEPSWGDLS